MQANQLFTLWTYKSKVLRATRAAERGNCILKWAKPLELHPIRAFCEHHPASSQFISDFKLQRIKTRL